MFPFLSVLAAVMGTLVLIISGMSQVSLASPNQLIDPTPEEATEKSPIYVECSVKGLLIYPDDVAERPKNKPIKPVFVPRKEVQSEGSAWSRLLERLQREHEQRYLILLVRPDAIGLFDKVYRMAQATEIDIGYDPLHQLGNVRFTHREETDDSSAKSQGVGP
jgi:hypothetical protein